MGKRGDKKRKADEKRKRTRRANPRLPRLDPHVEVLFDSIASIGALLAELTNAADPLAEAETRIVSVVEQMASALVGVEPAGVIEVIRMTLLPWSFYGESGSAGAESGLAASEVLALAFLGSPASAPGPLRPVDQNVCGILNDALPKQAREFLDLTSARDIVAGRSADAIDRIAFEVRSAGKILRSSSYSEMQAETVRGLFEHPDVRVQVEQELGFGVDAALLFLETCHAMQSELLNDRRRRLAEAWDNLSPADRETPTDEQKAHMRDVVLGLFNPGAQEAAIELSTLASRSGIGLREAEALVDFFKLDRSPGAIELLTRLADGDSPLRSTPLIVLDDRVMLLHPAHIQEAIKESFETALGSTSAWDGYQQHRGKYLESRIQELMGRVLPGATALHGFEYFIPNDEQEASAGPKAYTKLVEGDHLYVVDDVAVIVEDKAIPLSARSRTGEIPPLRRNLARAITKGADQAGRLKARLIEDGGLRLRDVDWVDLSAIREVHAVVTSLDDLNGISTATTQLLSAGLLRESSVPWTVSLHDLDLITQIVDRPAEFLLYLRRRTDPSTTTVFTATDELDFFLAFLKRGLYAERDPAEVARELPWMTDARPGDVRRYKKQGPTLVTSQTDELDAWFYSLHPPAGALAREPARKPTMVASPLADLIDLLCSRQVFGWLSVGATLLEGATKAQQRLANIGPSLVSLSEADKEPHSLALPWGTSLTDSWLLVWTSRPASFSLATAKAHTETYLAAKRAQYGTPRGFAFLYDSPTGELVHAPYDSADLVVDESLSNEICATLRDVGDIDTLAQFSMRLRNR